MAATKCPKCGYFTCGCASISVAAELGILQRQRLQQDKCDTAVRSNLTAANPLDSQVGGDHYKNLAIQPIEFTHKNKLDFLQGNIIKYTTRHKNKNGLEDIKKIIHYAKLIAKLDYDTEL